MAAPSATRSATFRGEAEPSGSRAVEPQELHTSLEAGLSPQEAAKRLREHGYNEVPEEKEHALVRFLRKFWGPTPWMLELTAILTFLVNDPAKVRLLRAFRVRT